MGNEGDLGGLEDLLVDDNGLVGLVAVLVVGGSDGGSSKGQSGNEGGGDLHGEKKKVSGEDGGLENDRGKKKVEKEESTTMLNVWFLYY